MAVGVVETEEEALTEAVADMEGREDTDARLDADADKLGFEDFVADGDEVDVFVFDALRVGVRDTVDDFVEVGLRLAEVEGVPEREAAEDLDAKAE